MDTKKDIGQFFNEHLNQMDFMPNEDGWNKIENELQEKKRKKRIFFWLFFASFLSGCLLTLFLVYGTNLFPSNSENGKNRDNSVTFENGNINVNSNSNSNISNTNSYENKNVTIDSESKQLNRNTNNEVSSTNYKFESENAIKNSNTHHSNINNTNSNKIHTNKINRQNSKTFNKENGNVTNTSIYKISKTKSKNKYHSKQKSKSITFRNKSKQKKNNSKNTEFNLGIAAENNAIANNSKPSSETITKSIDATQINEILATDTICENIETKKASQKPKKPVVKDSAKVVIKNNGNAFILSPYYGFGFLNKNQVKGNFKEGKDLKVTNEHYGFLFRWMTSKNYGLQIGLGYINASTKTEIEKTNSNTLFFNDVDNNSNASFPTSNKLIMTHEVSMYEIPLEFYYKLLDRKIGFGLSSGVSHTIIKSNDVYVESPDERTRIGKLETITNQSFSANLKVYSFYKLSDKIQLELYPSFQYQFLNAVRSKDLNPYIFSIRAGISYQF